MNSNRKGEGISVTACLCSCFLDRCCVSMTKSFPVVGALAALIVLLSVGCGRANVIEVLLECPSPDGAVTAVLWVEGGGGAAGWTQDLTSIHPASADDDAVYLTDEPAEESVVLALNRGEGYLLRWESNNQLLIDVTFVTPPQPCCSRRVSIPAS
jgi:hypothetical protein